MPGLSDELKQKLLSYKTSNGLFRQHILLELKASLQEIKACKVTEDTIADLYDKLDGISTQIAYIDTLQRMETQICFPIAQDFYTIPMIDEFKPLGDYFEFGDPYQMRFRQSPDDVPMEIYLLFKKSQIEYLKIMDDLNGTNRSAYFQLESFDPEKQSIDELSPVNIRLLGGPDNPLEAILPATKDNTAPAQSEEDFKKRCEKSSREIETLTEINAASTGAQAALGFLSDTVTELCGREILGPQEELEINKSVEKLIIVIESTTGQQVLDPNPRPSSRNASDLSDESDIQRYLEHYFEPGDVTEGSPPPSPRPASGDRNKIAQAYSNFVDTCTKILEADNSCLLKSLLTVTAIAVTICTVGTAGFAVGLLAGAWASPAAFVSAMLAGAAQAKVVAAISVTSGLGAGIYTGLTLFGKTHKADGNLPSTRNEEPVTLQFT